VKSLNHKRDPGGYDGQDSVSEGNHPSLNELARSFSGPGRIRRFSRYFYDRFLRLHGSPREIARGAALGFFVAMTPTMGIQMYIVVPIAALFKVSKVAAAAAVWVTNPLTAPFLYGVNYMIGAKLLGYPLKCEFLSNPGWETFWHSSQHVIVSLILGGTVTGIILGAVGYFVVLGMVKTAREKARRLKQKIKR
jgi:uncharacterized protein (DUF2062 family)